MRYNLVFNQKSKENKMHPMDGEMAGRTAKRGLECYQTPGIGACATATASGKAITRRVRVADLLYSIGPTTPDNVAYVLSRFTLNPLLLPLKLRLQLLPFGMQIVSLIDDNVFRANLQFTFRHCCPRDRIVNIL